MFLMFLVMFWMFLVPCRMCLPSSPPPLFSPVLPTPRPGICGAPLQRSLVYKLPLGLSVLVPPGLLCFGAWVELMRRTLVFTSARLFGRPCLRVPKFLSESAPSAAAVAAQCKV